MSHERLTLVARRNRRHIKIDLLLAAAMTLGLAAGAATVSAQVGMRRPQPSSTAPAPAATPQFPADLVQLARLEG